MLRLIVGSFSRHVDGTDKIYIALGPLVASSPANPKRHSVVYGCDAGPNELNMHSNMTTNCREYR